jgi:hypothetical protein
VQPVCLYITSHTIHNLKQAFNRKISRGSYSPWVHSLHALRSGEVQSRVARVCGLVSLPVACSAEAGTWEEDGGEGAGRGGIRSQLKCEVQRRECMVNWEAMWELKSSEWIKQKNGKRNVGKKVKCDKLSFTRKINEKGSETCEKVLNNFNILR